MLSIGSGIGKYIARISSPDKKRNGLIVSIIDDVEQKKLGDKIHSMKLYENLQLNDNEEFEPMPSKSLERDILLFNGPSGSGKSYLAKKFLRNYERVYNSKRPIYMFSRLNEDKSLDDVKSLKRVKLDHQLFSDPIGIDHLENSCVIMDDIDALQNKKVKGALMDIKNDLLENGRHKNISMLLTSHLPCKGKESASQLNEAHQIFVYPQSGAPYDYLFQKYLKFNRKKMNAIDSMKSRFIGVIRSYPQFVLTQTEILPLKSLDRYLPPSSNKESEAQINFTKINDVQLNQESNDKKGGSEFKPVNTNGSARGTYHCDYCNKNISSTNKRRHELSKKHKMTVYEQIVNKPKKNRKKDVPINDDNDDALKII